MKKNQFDAQEVWEKPQSFLMRLGKTRSILIISLFSIAFSVLVTVLVGSLIDGVDLGIAATMALVISGIVAPAISWIFTGQFVRLEAMERRMRQLATYDSLTGLLSRQAFYYDAQRYLNIARQHRDYFVVMVLDLDHFKQINDTHGHHVGDRVLKRFGLFLSDSLRDSDIIGRLGGEEFAVILPHTLPHHAQKIADTFCTELSALDILGDASLHITVSIGLVFHTSETPPNLDVLLRQADQALYQAKQNGRNNAVLYDPMGASLDKEESTATP